MNAYYSAEGKKTAVLGAIKAQLPLSEGKYHPLNLWNKISFDSYNFLSYEFSAITSEQIK